MVLETIQTGGLRLADIEIKTSSIEMKQWFKKPFKLVGIV
jgi:hypothetical protein